MNYAENIIYQLLKEIYLLKIKNHEYNMRKKYSFLREQFRDLMWQKTVYDKIIDI